MSTADQVFPFDLTPQERHDTRLEARRVIQEGSSVRDHIVVMMQPPPPPWLPLDRRADGQLIAWRIELRIARATCPVHPDMVTILHEDEKIDGNPCPLCWAAAAFIPTKERPAPTPAPGPGRLVIYP